MKKINEYFVEHRKLTLLLMWIFVIIAVGIGSVIALFYTDMDYFRFLAWVAVPAILAIYFRIMYGRYENKRREQLAAEHKLANQTRYGHDRKKKKKK